MAKIIFYISFVPLVLLAYFIAVKIYAFTSRSISEARDQATVTFKRGERRAFNRRFYTELNKNEKLKTHFDRINEKLVAQGNPYHLNAFTYYLSKIIPSAILLCIFIGFKAIGLLELVLVAFAFFYVDLKYFFQNREDQKMILRDLPNIYNALEVQSYGDIPFEKSLMSLHNIIKCKRLKEAFIEMSAEIVTNKDIVLALHHMEKKFKMQEIYSFTLTIEQGLETGKIREMLGNQRIILYKTYLTAKDDETDKNELKVTLCLMLLLVSSGAITLYSFFDNILKQLDFIFKF